MGFYCNISPFGRKPCKPYQAVYSLGTTDSGRLVAVVIKTGLIGRRWDWGGCEVRLEV